ncbi:MAG: hypothetical protein HY901_27585 [Deltaproteobacteria bacterium]|nr:hypothetical protein [Deltaproteobacteria bacterium]
MNFVATFPEAIPAGESIVLPISMAQPLERGERLGAIIQAFKEKSYQDRVTILVCDYLNRHNCSSDSEAIELGDQFIKDHATVLQGFRMMRWKELIDSQPSFPSRLKEVIARSAEGTQFHNKLIKTWEKCLSASQALASSLQYQIEEYAAILCMDEFDHLFYPKRITNGMAYLYNFVDGKKPKYHYIRVSEVKDTQWATGTSAQGQPQDANKKDRRHIHVAFRGLIEHAEILLSSGELSHKAKGVFAEELENVLMSHGLLGQKANRTEEPWQEEAPPPGQSAAPREEIR